LRRWGNPKRCRHFQPVAERDTEVLEVFLGYVGNNGDIDPVYPDMPSLLSQLAICCVAPPRSIVA
jgi:hypothetical protein